MWLVAALLDKKVVESKHKTLGNQLNLLKTCSGLHCGEESLLFLDRST